MNIYIYIWVFIVINILSPTKIKNNNFVFFSFFIFLFLFIGLRYEIGGDWNNYSRMYSTISQLSLTESLKFTDPAYGLLNWIAFKFSLGLVFINIICSFIFISGLYLYSKDKYGRWLIVLIAYPYLILAVSMGYTRQAAAFGFFLLSIIALSQNKPIKFIFLIFLGTLFHKTLIIFIFLLPFFIKDKKKKRNIFLSILFISPFLFLAFYEKIVNQLYFYFENELHSDGGLLRLLINIIPSILFFIFYNRWKKSYSEDTQLILILSLLSFILLAFQFFASTISDRIGLYLIILQLIIYPKILYLIKDKVIHSVFSLSIIAIYSGMLFVWLNYSPWAQCCWIPYKNYLFNY
ncbi:EpsG family protein [Proteus mirabilis]|uniref:EpsG family protein n=1 Tax=Proteus mirabilis TaxID=584 RepID=UPI002246D389|nr:EpsG family protein [Proteus mirabilis]MCW4528217.1 EpsG family protein [Proteus mirabilis]MCW9693815.1 EpsG family protein [Proteus mirabilis]HCZ8848494.1 EpsG family protein [Proteus mirabilis]